VPTSDGTPARASFTRLADSPAAALHHDAPVERKIAILVVLVALFLSTIVLAASAQNEYCLPWQERVGHGDGVLGPDDDYTTCR
jgi:hypothetical protein